MVLSCLVFSSWVLSKYLRKGGNGEFQGNWDGKESAVEFWKNFYLDETPTFLSFTCLFWDRADENHGMLNTMGILHFPFPNPSVLEQGPNPVSASKGTLTTLGSQPLLPNMACTPPLGKRGTAVCMAPCSFLAPLLWPGHTQSLTSTSSPW